MVETMHLLGGECEKEDEHMGAETFECEVEIEVPKGRDGRDIPDRPDSPEGCRASDYHYWVEGDEVSGHCRQLPEEEIPQ